MIEPTEQDIGRKVIYRDLSGRGKIQEGAITSFNSSFVFVRYDLGCTSAPTRREDLEWSFRRTGETAVRRVLLGGEVFDIDFCEPPQPE